MVKQFNRLSARKVKTAKDGFHADGGNLFLSVSGGSRRKSWVFRFTRDGKVTAIGLGSAHSVPLAAAREKAKDLRGTLADGKHPLAERKRIEAEEEAKKTFSQVATLVIESNRDHWGASSLQAWSNSLFGEAKQLSDLNVADVGVDHVKRVVMPIFELGKHVSARRTLSRISAVLRYARANGWRTDADAADWRDFKHIAPKRPKADRRHPMLPWQDAPAAFARLPEVVGMSARCIELVALTAVRLTEARAARWSEFDLDNAVWTIPATRMKMRVEHTVPLSKQAVDFLTGLKAHRAGPYVFFGRNTRSPVSPNMCWEMCRRVTEGKGSPHGWRATFRSWCGANGVDRELAEAALAHSLPGVEGAYHREPMIERRRPVMEAWASFLSGDAARAKVVPFRTKRRSSETRILARLAALLATQPASWVHPPVRTHAR